MESALESLQQCLGVRKMLQAVGDMRWWLKELGFGVVRTYYTWGIPVLKHVWPAMFAQNVIYLIVQTPESVIREQRMVGTSSLSGSVRPVHSNASAV